MRHLRTLALCLGALFALGALVAAGASAETLPAVYQCGAAKKEGKKYVGHYVGKHCGAAEKATKAQEEEGKKNKYEFEPWNPGESTSKGGKENWGKKGTVKSFKGGGKIADLEVVGLGGIECKKSTNTGEFTGPKTVGDIVVHFSECALLLTKICQSKGAKAGEIVTNTLDGEVGYVNAAKHEVGADFSAAPPNAYLAEFSCETLNLRVSGSVIGEVVPGEKSAYGKFSKEVTLNFTQARGKQDIQSFEGFPKDTLVTENCNGCEPNSEPAESGQQGVFTNKGEELYLNA